MPTNFPVTIKSTLLPADQLTVSPGQATPTNVSQVSIQLVDTDGMWDTTTGTLVWGAQYSNDGGANWQWLSGGPTTPVAIGFRSKGGGLPSVFLSSQNLVVAGGGLVRLAAQPDVDIRLGAVINAQ